MYAKVTNGVAVPYTMKQLRQDNPDTIFPKEMSDESLLEYSVYKVVESDPPPFEENVEYIDDVLGFIDNQVIQDWVVIPYDIEDAKDNYFRAITSLREDREQAHPTLDTTFEGQARMGNVLSVLQSHPNLTVHMKRKNNTVSVENRNTIDQEALSIFNWSQDHLAREAELYAEVDACTTVDELKIIDIESGWPAVSEPVTPL